MYEVIDQVSFDLSDIKYLALVFLLKHEEEYVGKLCFKKTLFLQVYFSLWQSTRIAHQL